MSLIHNNKSLTQLTSKLVNVPTQEILKKWIHNVHNPSPEYYWWNVIDRLYKVYVIVSLFLVLPLLWIVNMLYWMTQLLRVWLCSNRKERRIFVLHQGYSCCCHDNSCSYRHHTTLPFLNRKSWGRRWWEFSVWFSFTSLTATWFLYNTSNFVALEASVLTKKGVSLCFQADLIFSIKSSECSSRLSHATVIVTTKIAASRTRKNRVVKIWRCDPFDETETTRRTRKCKSCVCTVYMIVKMIVKVSLVKQRCENIKYHRQQGNTRLTLKRNICNVPKFWQNVSLSGSKARSHELHVTPKISSSHEKSSNESWPSGLSTWILTQ